MKRSKPLYFLTALILSIVALVSGITISAGYDRLDALTSLERVEREHKSLWQRIFESMQNLNWADLFNKLAGVIDWEDFFSHLPANFDWAGFLNSLPADFDWSDFWKHLPKNFDWKGFFEGLPDNFDFRNFLKYAPSDFDYSKLPWGNMTADQLAGIPWDQIPLDQFANIPFEQFSRDQLLNVPWDQLPPEVLGNVPWDKLTDEQWYMLLENPNFPWGPLVGLLGLGLWKYLPDGFRLPEGVLPEGVVPEHDHIWGEWITVDPTCDAPGYRYHRCTFNGCTETQKDDNFTISPLGHKFDANSICERCHRRRLVITSHGTPQGGVTYNGAAHIVEGYDYDEEMLLPEHHVQVSGYYNNAIDVGTYRNTFYATVIDENGNVVSDNYVIDKEYGKIVVTPRKLVITTDSKEKKFDGSSFSVEDLGEPHIIGGDGLVKGHELYAFEFDISDIVLGSWQNSLLYVRIGPPDSAGGHIDMTKNYAIECIAGDLHIYR